MSEREPLSKKIRFNVFKRDSFQCQYCGQTPPKVVLEIDHIQPVSKGGKNNIDNLLTACFDCNRGKSNGLLTAIPMSILEKAEILKEKQEQVKAFEKLNKAIQRKVQKDINTVEDAFRVFFPDYYFNDGFRTSVKRFLEDLPVFEVVDAMDKACSRCNRINDVTKYFCGICWKKIKGEDYGSR
jgi:hypothetical protein